MVKHGLNYRPFDRLVSSFSYIYNESKEAGGEKLYTGIFSEIKHHSSLIKTFFKVDIPI
jgi:hypothetical protein